MATGVLSEEILPAASKHLRVSFETPNSIANFPMLVSMLQIYAYYIYQLLALSIRNPA